MRLRKTIAVLLGLLSLFLASTASAYSPATALVGDYVTKSSGPDLGYVAPQKSQSSATQLFFSNNPESMDSSTIFSGKASVLGYTNLQVGKTYRIYVAHTNNYGNTLNFALMIKGTSAGSFTLTKKAVSIGSSNEYPTIGVNSARDFLNSSYSQTLSIPTSWTYYDGPYTMYAGQSEASLRIGWAITSVTKAIPWRIPESALPVPTMAGWRKRSRAPARGQPTCPATTA